MLFSFRISSAFRVGHLFLPNEGSIVNPGHTGLLLLRAYAVTDHKRLLLAILGILGGCAIGLYLVCVLLSLFL